MGAYFVSPIAYLVMAAFLLISGFFFSIILIGSQQASMQGLFANVTVILLFVAPLLTMRLLADEQRTGTLEVLLTAPVHDWEVVVGKFVAALALFTLMLCCTLVYPLVLVWLGSTPDWGPVISGYIGLLLLAGAMLAIGTMASAVSENQIVTAFIAFAILLLLWLIGAASQVLPTATAVFEALSLNGRYQDFVRGAINLEDVVYYLSLMIGSLFIATRLLETRHYR
jgi:ABC-2 type transport system permease protein